MKFNKSETGKKAFFYLHILSQELNAFIRRRSETFSPPSSGSRPWGQEPRMKCLQLRLYGFTKHIDSLASHSCESERRLSQAKVRIGIRYNSINKPQINIISMFTNSVYVSTKYVF